MDKARFFEWIERHRRVLYAVSIPFILGLMGLVYLLVYYTGGVRFVYSHTMYIPILLSGFIFLIKGGLAAGILAGVLLGPIMPLNTLTGEMQETINWVYRLVFFTGIGLFSGAAGDSARAFIHHFRWLSQHDPVTSLPNRTALFASLKNRLGSKQPSGEPGLSLFLLEIENALELSSSFGFGITDYALPVVARRMKSGKIALEVYQTGSRQLGLVVPCNHTNHQSPQGTAAAIMEECQEAIQYGRIPVHLDVRLGSVPLPREETDPRVLLQQAETALAEAEQQEASHRDYDAVMIQGISESVELLGELKRAVLEGQIDMHYQPKVDLRSGRVYGVEALMRWNHPEKGSIPPGRFIPRAEQSTLIQLITDFALERSLAQLAAWHKTGMDLTMAVNISTRNLLQPGFTAMVLSTLEHLGISGEYLELEVTEGALMMDMERTLDELTRLAEANLVISIDDFGTGYSSLQYLHQMPVSLLKIDQSFIRRLPKDRSAGHILDAAVSLAHNLGIKTIAEGVEDRRVFDYLQTTGCDMAQGFIIAPAMDAPGFVRWYQSCQGVWKPGDPAKQPQT